MPYMFVSTLIRLENGPTVIGDEWLDREVADYLNAKLSRCAGNTFKEWSVDQPPRIVLNKLEQIGYHVIGTTGCGQTMIWTLHRSS